MNRNRPASMLTKREQVAKDLLIAMVAKHDPYPTYRVDDLAADAVAHADALFDELDTPTELRDFDHEGHP